jgi:hypothetical protein
MTNLFGNILIKSISFSNKEIINNIISLYLPDGIECDCTYSKGYFYNEIKKPRLKFDINPIGEDVVRADCRNLPLENKSLSNLMFDPPFQASWHINSRVYKMSKRFDSVKGINNLLRFYQDSIKEFSRVLRSRGILIVKCQDLCYGRSNYFNHISIYEYAIQNNFRALDLFILLARNRITGSGSQNHARKFHSYFWVFKKI